MEIRSIEKPLHYTLRLAVAMCFIGHGVFGIITKPIWCNYFGVFGINHEWSYRLMPIVGSCDVLLGIAMLVRPVRAIPMWLVFWGICTAALRPLSGEPFAEFIERAGNFGAPLAFVLLAGEGRSLNAWFARIPSDMPVAGETYARIAVCLRVVVFLLLFGHGWLNLIEKPGLLDQYAALGFSNPISIAHKVGLLEMTMACVVLIRPTRPLLLALFFWKMATELFYPQHAVLEWIERGGSYGALRGLWLVLSAQPARQLNKSATAALRARE